MNCYQTTTERRQRIAGSACYSLLYKLRIIRDGLCRLAYAVENCRLLAYAAVCCRQLV